MIIYFIKVQNFHLNIYNFIFQIIETYQSSNLLEKIMQLLNVQKECDEIFHKLHPSWCLSLIANIVHLAELSSETEQFEKNSSTVFIVS